LREPKISGTLRGDALALEAPPWGIAWRDGRLRAELDENRLRVTEARIAGGDGTLSAKGTFAIGAGDAMLEWQAEHFTLLGRPDMRAVVSGNGTTSFDGQKLGLVGDLRVENGRFERVTAQLPRLDDDVEVVGRERPPGRKRVPLPIDLDLKLDLGKRLTLRAYGFNGGVTGQERIVTNAAGALLAQGRVQAVNATFLAYGQELEVDPGSLVFDGPLENPALDITAWRRRQQVEAGVHVTGTVETPRVDLVSNPPVSEGDRLSWLVLGRAPTEASPADLAVLQAAGGAVLLAEGRDLPPLHLIYGLVPLGVAFVAEQLRLASADTVLQQRGLEGSADVAKLEPAEQRALVSLIVRRETGVMAASAIVVALLAGRAQGWVL
jgi:translocation and assembly module TamB